VNRSIGNFIIIDEFALCVYLCMAFKFIKSCSVLFGLTGICIFVPLSVWLVIPKFITSTFIYYTVFFPFIALAWCNCKTGIYHFTFIHYQSLLTPNTVQIVKIFLQSIRNLSSFHEMPKQFFIRHFISTF